ncbi:MAG: response regulator, partial [Pedobacter sp.]
MSFNQHPISILIIEDNYGDVLLLREVLNDTGLKIMNIAEATDLRSAKLSLLQNKPDLIFLDLSLPDCSGLESFLRVQQSSGSTPIVILTGSNDTKLALEAINKGAQDFLIKGDVDEKLLAKTILYSIERKRISESLQLSNERYHLVSIATNDMVWDWDLMKNKVFRSQSGWDKLFGLDQYDQSTHPDSWWDRVHPEDRERTTAKISEILDNKHIDQFEIECRIHTGNNNYAHVVDRGYAIRNDNGDAVRLIGVTQNVTEKKRSEEELKRLSLIAKETLNAVIITDPYGYIQWVNEAFYNISGFTFEEVVGKKPGDLLQGPETSAVVKRYMRIRIKSGKHFECDLVNYRKTGEKYWIRIQCQPQFDDKG